MSRGLLPGARRVILSCNFPFQLTFVLSLFSKCDDDSFVICTPKKCTPGDGPPHHTSQFYHPKRWYSRGNPLVLPRSVVIIPIYSTKILSFPKSSIVPQAWGGNPQKSVPKRPKRSSVTPRCPFVHKRLHRRSVRSGPCVPKVVAYKKWHKQASAKRSKELA